MSRLAMWHRVMTRPWVEIGCRVRSGESLITHISECVRLAEARLVCDDVSRFVDDMTAVGCGYNITEIGACKPLAKATWVEFSAVLDRNVSGDERQAGALFVLSDESDSTYVASVFVERRGEPTALLQAACVSFDHDGNVVNWKSNTRFSDVSVKLCGVVIGRCLHAFAFAHCKNVELVEAKNHGPDEKWCRRQKVPSVVYKTLKIPGFERRYVGGDGTATGAEHRLHICRGHFATYTADKPLFGRPDGVGKFWHPAHVRGNAKHGAVVKDYVVSP